VIGAAHHIEAERLLERASSTLASWRDRGAEMSVGGFNVSGVDMSDHLALGVLWGKSNAGPEGNARANLLLQHLLDAAAVGELRRR
jgi:hypothetical protein